MTAADRETTAQPVRTGSGRQQGLVELFQKHDNLGSLVLLPSIGGYQQTIVYVGAYTRLTAFPFPQAAVHPSPRFRRTAPGTKERRSASEITNAQ